MQRLKNDNQDHISQQIEMAARLHEDDQKKSQALKERRAATEAAEEMGIPASYMEQAAVELATRRSIQVRRRRRGNMGILAASVAAVAAFGSWAAFHQPPAPPPPPLVFDFAATAQGQWHLDGLYGSHPDAQASLTYPQEQGHPVALVKIDRFSRGSDYAVDLSTNQVPHSLTGYRTVSFRVRGQGLGQVRLFLQNGEERWCSPFLTASGSWHEVRVPLSQFLHQRVPAQYNPQDEPYVGPNAIGNISFKLGRDANSPDEHGEVAVDDLRFE